ncbi:putative catechol O-methyltransferase [Podospora australis]|uniref:catechol O-methyltransferase n=1 Tax=Podospora australis TaxID=1536484 RepID=A0AAN6WLY8_9PEZI|nr:putative catechol O-methyltransferase [Podospora australis]
MATTTITEVPVSTFDMAGIYKPWEVDGKFYGDGREVALLEYIYNHPELDQMRGNPQKVLGAMDSFARSVTGLINVGQTKGAVVRSIIAQRKPKVILELGGYCGYSAIMFSNAIREVGGVKYFSVEKSPLFAAVASSLIDLAGLRDVVRVVVGTGAEGTHRLHDEGALPHPVDMAFFDHFKPAYTADLKLCERLGLVGKGTVLVGDNMIVPGNPLYLDWVRSSVAEKREKDKVAEEKGNPNLIYSSRSIPSWEPSGQEDAMEITECLGIEA